MSLSEILAILDREKILLREPPTQDWCQNLRVLIIKNESKKKIFLPEIGKETGSYLENTRVGGKTEIFSQ